jgi:hypothetical protein
LHFDEGWKDPNSTNDDAIRALRPAGVIRVDYAFGNEGRGESVAGVKFEAKRERDGPYYATFWSDMSGAIKGVHATGQYLSVK